MLESFLLNNKTSPLPVYHNAIHIFYLFRRPFTLMKLILAGVNLVNADAVKHKELNQSPCNSHNAL